MVNQTRLQGSPESYVRSEKRSSLPVERLRAGINLSSQKAPKNTAAELDSRAKDLIKHIEERERYNDRVGILLKANKYLITGLLVANPILAVTVGALLDRVETEYERSSSASLKRSASVGLATIRKDLRRGEWNALVSETMAGRMESLTTVAGTLLGDSFDKIQDQHVRDKVQNAVILEMAEIIKNGEKISAAQMQEFSQQIKKLERLENQRRAQPKPDAPLPKSSNSPEELFGDDTAAAIKLRNETAKQAASASQQLGAAAEIFGSVGMKEAAESASLASGVAALVATAALAQADPSQILPTVSLALKLVGVGRDSIESIEAQRQQQILAKLDHIISMLEDVQKQLTERMQHLSNMVSISLSYASQILSGDISLCSHLVPPGKLASDRLPDHRQSLFFDSYEALESHYESFAARHVLDCLKAIDLHFTHPSISTDAPFSMYFALVEEGDEDSQDAARRRRYYNEIALKIVRHAISDGAVAILPAIADSFSSLEAKMKEVRADVPSAFYTKYLDHVLDPGKLLRAVRYLLAAVPYYEYISPDGKLKSKGDIEAGVHGFSLEGRGRLEVALGYIDVCLAQQALIAGDMLLPLFHSQGPTWGYSFRLFKRDMEASSKALPEGAYAGTALKYRFGSFLQERWYDDKLSQQSKSNAVISLASFVERWAYELFTLNPALARNFVHYLILKELEYNGKSIADYQQALSEGVTDLPRAMNSAYQMEQKVFARHTLTDWVASGAARPDLNAPSGVYFPVFKNVYTPDPGKTGDPAYHRNYIHIPDGHPTHYCISLPTGDELSDDRFILEPTVTNLVHARSIIGSVIASYPTREDDTELWKRMRKIYRLDAHAFKRF